jgi:hypothetical protein
MAGCGDSAVGIAPGYGLADRGGRSSSPGRVKNSFLYVVQTGSGAHPDSYSMGPGGKATGADHSPPTSAEVKKT